MPMPFQHRLARLPRSGALGYFLAVVACAVVTVLARLLTAWLAPANIVMLFLLTVFLVALYLGRRPAMLAAFLGVASFDFFFVQPHFSFAVEDAQYLVTFAVMLAVALITGHLAARLSQQAEAALEREAHTRALYEMARELAGALAVAQVADTTTRFLQQGMFTTSSLFLPDAEDQLHAVADGEPASRELALPRRAYQRGEAVEVLGFSGRGVITLYLPLRTPMATRGVLEITADSALVSKERGLLDAVASLAAIALERLHYVEVAQAVETRMAAERLRHSMLASLSHDLRTPLTALVGLADTLLLAVDPSTHRETAQALRAQAMALARMVNNLLDLARLSAGGMALRREWQPLEEVAGAAIKLLGSALEGHPVMVRLPADLPLLEFDAVLLERVIGNLLDNAAKFAPTGSPIVLEARRGEAEVEITVSDQGPGFPRGLDLAEPFVRGTSESSQPGIGLGLAIAQTIVAAHGGHLSLINPPSGGARARFTLPLGTPPAILEEAP